MRKRFWLCRRNRTFYVKDAQTQQRISLQTSDRAEAARLVHAREEAEHLPMINLNIAKTYLAAADPRMTRRTWREVMDQFCSRGATSTRKRRERAMCCRAFDLIRDQRIVETTADQLREILTRGGVFTKHAVRLLHNLALGLGWLPWPIIPAKLWPEIATKPKRAITWEEHELIIASERSAERKNYYELLWEIGASQTDGANLAAENIDWEQKTLTYFRQKTGELACMSIGPRLATLLNSLPSKGPLFPRVSNTLDKHRAAEFRRRCRILKIEGISLHSYRYAWAERARTCGYPERFAQEALGHNSKAVHRAYAKRAQVKIPAMEEYEKAAAEKIIQLSAQPGKAV